MTKEELQELLDKLNDAIGSFSSDVYDLRDSLEEVENRVAECHRGFNEVPCHALNYILKAGFVPGVSFRVIDKGSYLFQGFTSGMMVRSIDSHGEENNADISVIAKLLDDKRLEMFGDKVECDLSRIKTERLTLHVTYMGAPFLCMYDDRDTITRYVGPAAPREAHLRFERLLELGQKPRTQFLPYGIVTDFVVNFSRAQRQEYLQVARNPSELVVLYFALFGKRRCKTILKTIERWYFDESKNRESPRHQGNAK